jgi:uncharacterized protein (TIGR03435 family)
MTGTDYAEMNVSSWTMDQLTRQLSAQLHDPVWDETGLAGNFDYKLSWSDTNSAYSSLFTALQEQLGLKLEPHKGPIHIMVIDSAAKPSLD